MTEQAGMSTKPNTFPEYEICVRYAEIFLQHSRDLEILREQFSCFSNDDVWLIVIGTGLFMKYRSHPA